MNKQNKYKSTRRVTYSCKYHVIWCPKYRRKVLKEGVDVRLKEIIFEIAAAREAEVLELEVMEDHVHAILEISPQFGIHKLVKQIKGTSSRILRNEFIWLKSRIPTLWTHSYFVSTVGGAPLEKIKSYVEKQKTV